MNRRPAIDSNIRPAGFTLIELLTALLILSILSLMTYRGLGAVLDARQHIKQETDKWRRVSIFFARFERDAQLAAPRSVRADAGSAAEPAWHGKPGTAAEPHLAFSRFAWSDKMGVPQRLAYHLNPKNEVELWLWPGLDMPPGTLPARYPLLTGVTTFELAYLSPDLQWHDAWPSSPNSPLDPSIPLAVKCRLVLASGEEVVRVFALKS